MAFVEVVKPRDVTRQHSRIGRVGGVGNQNQAHPRQGIHTPQFQGDGVAVSATDEDEIAGNGR